MLIMRRAPLVPCHRPPALLHFLHGARQQLLRVGALLNDPNKLVPVKLVADTGSVLDVAATHARALQSAADELYAANQHLKALRVPLFDVASALDVLSTGGLQKLCTMNQACVNADSEQQHDASAPLLMHSAWQPLITVQGTCLHLPFLHHCRQPQ